MNLIDSFLTHGKQQDFARFKKKRGWGISWKLPPNSNYVKFGQGLRNCVAQTLEIWLSVRPLPSNRQHGFISGRSTATKFSVSFKFYFWAIVRCRWMPLYAFFECFWPSWSYYTLVKIMDYLRHFCSFFRPILSESAPARRVPRICVSWWFLCHLRCPPGLVLRPLLFII